MKKILAAGLGMLALAAMQPANAADMPVKAVYKAPPVEVWSWTGFYIGLNGGYSWGRSDTRLDLLNGATGAVLASINNNFNLNGGIFGAQAGYNWQSGSMVFGIETDIQWSGEKGSTLLSCNLALCLPTAIAPGGALAATAALSQKIDWFGTLRGRLGVLAAPTVLLYVTGGLAYGDVKSDLLVAGFNANGAPLSAAFTNSTLHAGWTVGAGIEGRLGGNWTGKLEYLYMDLGTFSGTSTILAVGPPTLQAAYSSRVRDNVFRAGINYKFGSAVVAAY
jgi:outer membrane immunogenic protein